MTEESAVKVCVRVRPLIKREESAASEDAGPVQLFWKADKKSLHQIDDGNSTKSFSFDRVFTVEETTNQLYQDIAKPLVVSTVEGYNGTIFAYGQTSSGKTFTMMGSDHVPGVIPLAVEDVFQTIKNFPKKEFLLRVSYMEIYNETVTDLLVDSWKRKPLEVRETINKNIYVADLTEELVTSPAQVLAWIRKGEKNRHYGKTKMNQRSSRSHTIFRMILESRERSDPASGENADGAIIVSHLNLVDLAGSERASQTGAEGARFKEGCNINRSLFTLGQVIKKLTDEGQKGFTNYRDSKLTRILQNSLGGNAKTVIICTITPVALDETLSTLQFASTAKKMKNDPHVTEVSDDGALLKRYRNEIVDLKRRLHEVSSVTQTTATEKEVLSQLLQEKNQLQREQQDRIRNLTKLLVTSSNLVPVQKKPKRRVTWGGKMLRLARPSACDDDDDDDGSSDLSFAESFTRKRKADRSCLMEIGEDDEDFDPHWGIPDEASDEMEISQSSVTVRSFGDSPRDLESSVQIRELSGKVSSLELQLKVESQQKEEAEVKAEALDGRVAELQLQLQTEAQQKQEAVEKMQIAEQRAAELELQTEAQQKPEATEKVTMLEFRVADLERQLEEQSHTEADEQMRREFAETIQLCETLASEKDAVVAERDYLKQELGMFIEQTESLEKDKAALAQELDEKRETDEFKSLEEEFRKEQESEWQNEISGLKKALESSEVQCLELQNKLQSVREDLKKKTEFAEGLQSVNGKDLVQEVAKLRRSLDDAEGVSRDTKKEWAVLRSQTMSLEEMNGTLTANHEKMEAEVNSLRFQLETEKSRYRKMQSDLHKELNVAFDENTKLSSLLEGKVPKNLIDSMELEKTVASLNKELTASREAEEALRAQLEQVPEKVADLMKQVGELTEELGAVQTQRDDMLSVQAQCQHDAQELGDALRTSQDEILKVQADLSAAALREEELSQQCADLTQQLERADAERSQLLASVEKRDSQLEEREQHRASLEGTLNEMQQLMKDLEDKLADSEVSRTTEEEISSELHEQLNQLNEELQCMRAEKDAVLSEQNAGVQSSAGETEKLLSAVTSLTAERDQLRMNLQEHLEKAAEAAALLQSLQHELQSVRDEKEALVSGVQSSAEEVEKLLSTLTSLTAERDQLKLDLQENVEMMIENQEELRTALEKSREQKQQIKQLETAQTSKLDGLPSDMMAQLEELQTHVKTLTEELHSVRAERDGLLAERTANTQDMEKLLCRLTSLSEDRDQLQETLEALRQEKQQLGAELEDRMEMAADQNGFNQPEVLSLELQTRDEKIEQLQAMLQAATEQKSQVEGDLQRSMDMLRAAEPQSRLHSLQEQLQEQNQRNVDVERMSRERQAQLEHQVAQTTDLLQSLQEELEQHKQNEADLVKLSEQKESHLEQQMKSLTEELESARTERDALLFEKEANTQTSTEEMEKLLCRLTSLSEDRDQLQETLEALRQEKQQLRAELEDRMEMMQCEFQQQQLSCESQSLKEEQEAQRLVQIQQLEEHLEKTKEEASQLKSDLQENVELMIENQEEMRVSQEKIRDLQEEITMLRSQKAELESRRGSDAERPLQLEELIDQIQTLTEELHGVRAERDGLLAERTANTQMSTEDMEELLCRLTSLSEDRDQLQETLEALRKEKQQLGAELEDRMEALQTEVAELNVSLQTVTEQKRQLTDDLQQSMNVVSSTQELLKSVQEELQEQQNMKSDLEALSQERECASEQQIRDLTEELHSVRADRDGLLAERTANTQRSTEDMEKLLCRLTSLSEDRDRLQETLEALRKEKQQLGAELEDRMEMISAMQDKLTQQEQLNVQQQAENAEREANVQQKLLSEAAAISSSEQSTSGVQEAASSRLQDSTVQLQESFKIFQHFVDTCSKYDSTALDKTLTVQGFLEHTSLTSLPKPTMDVYNTVCQLGLSTVQSQIRIKEQLYVRAQGCRKMFEELVKKDLAVFEERRLQDVLLCKAQAPSCSVKDHDFHTLWEHRLTELLDRRQLYLQKMANALEKLWAHLASFLNGLKAEIQEREKLKEQLQTTNQPTEFSGLDSILSRELDRRSAVAQNNRMLLQAIDEHGLFEELKQLEAQADSQLREEKSKSSTLLQALEGAPLKTELSLLEDNQQLVLQLQQAEGKVRALHLQKEQLEEARIKANNSLSNHKEATQLLQTELQDSRALVEDKENTIQTLKSKLRESERKASPTAAELGNLQTKLFKMEMKLSSASDEHQEEIQQMTTLLSEKEDSLRKLKETLRKSQQQGDESILQGEDLHARLTHPRGLVIKSSILLERTKLEEEVRQLQLKIIELESLVSCQQAEISKWKSRAFKLKVKSKAEVDKPSSSCTPTKRGLPMTSDSSNVFSSPKKFLITPKKILDSPSKILESPRKLLDSPKVSLLDSPKSRFFDVGGTSELLSRTCPKQFFDNSSLGTIPDAAAGADRKEWWPQSPKQEEMCKTQ